MALRGCLANDNDNDMFAAQYIVKVARECSGIRNAFAVPHLVGLGKRVTNSLAIDR